MSSDIRPLETPYTEGRGSFGFINVYVVTHEILTPSGFYTPMRLFVGIRRTKRGARRLGMRELEAQMAAET